MILPVLDRHHSFTLENLIQADFSAADSSIVAGIISQAIQAHQARPLCRIARVH